RGWASRPTATCRCACRRTSTSGSTSTPRTSGFPPPRSTSAAKACTALSRRTGGAMPDTRWGLTLPLTGGALHALEPIVRKAEQAGYDALWPGETRGTEGSTPLVLDAAWTERVRLGTGVVNAFTRGPAVLAQHAAALQDASNGRFCLGIGSSS